jgi:hypothetical protein
VTRNSWGRPARLAAVGLPAVAALPLRATHDARADPLPHLQHSRPTRPDTKSPPLEARAAGFVLIKPDTFFEPSYWL